jgi:hypothetical protein
VVFTDSGFTITVESESIQLLKYRKRLILELALLETSQRILNVVMILLLVIAGLSGILLVAERTVAVVTVIGVAIPELILILNLGRWLRKRGYRSELKRLHLEERIEQVLREGSEENKTGLSRAALR